MNSQTGLSEPFTGIGSLSDREKQVLRLIADGLTNCSIAEHLVISQRTVDHHVSHILTKLAVPNRTVATLAAQQAGLLRETSGLRGHPPN